MAIIEYLTVQDTAAADERAQFTVDTTGPVDVALYGPGGVVLSYLRNGQGFKNFAPDDNVRILSLGLMLPYQFTVSSRNIKLSAYWYDEVGASGPISELCGSAPGQVVLPFDGAEFPIDATVAHPSTGKKTGFIFYPFEPGVAPARDVTRVSMVNAPTALNTVVLRASVFAKVLHTLPMVA